MGINLIHINDREKKSIITGDHFPVYLQLTRFQIYKEETEITECKRQSENFLGSNSLVVLILVSLFVGQATAKLQPTMSRDLHSNSSKARIWQDAAEGF